MIDYHLHGNFCGHGEGELEEYVVQALEKGFIEIGFSAHLPKVIEPDPYHAMLEHELPRYVELVESLRDKYRDKIIIKLGIEADYFKNHEDKTRKLIDAHDFDYVLGSIHFLGEWHFSSREGLPQYRTEDPDEVFPRYFALLGEMIASRLFDIVSHPDAIRREYFRPSISMRDDYRKIARLLLDTNMALEVSSAGVRRGAGSIYPEREFLKECIDRGVAVTIGSDAHTPADVGRDYGDVFEMLEDLGIKEVATYNRRQMTQRPLGEYMRI
jgi:histidinol-phosphatase (PHP family)